MKTITKIVQNQIKSNIRKSFDFMRNFMLSVHNVTIPNTKRELEYYRLMVTYKMVRSLEIYTKNTDKCIKFSTQNGQNGSIEIEMTIERDGQNYFLNTETIIADGLINVAHYRYITKSDLPKTRNNKETKKLESQLKAVKTKNNKIDRLNEDIARTKKFINVRKKAISEFNKLTKADKIEKLKKEKSYLFLTWEDLNEGGRRNYKNPANFATYKANNIKAALENLAKIKTYKNNEIIMLKRDLAKYKLKLKEAKKL